jgi:chaperonin cofactor prefoldin
MNDQATHKKIEELRILESQLQNFLIQKQSIQLEINEINNALEEE